MSVQSQAFSELRQMGFLETESKQALAWAREQLGKEPVEPTTIVRMALQQLKRAA